MLTHSCKPRLKRLPLERFCFPLLCLISEGFFLLLSMISVSQAQISSDGTLSTNVNHEDNNAFTITGGTQVGGNLFHSFQEFSVPTGGSVTFANDLNVQNILSRVTGNSISNIDGLISANGSANLFLINPNGIIFGPDAQLKIGGSLIATTASQVNFADNTVFSTTDLQPHPILTVSIPIGLQFRQNPGDIVIRSTLFGLQVEPGKTLSFLGGNILLDGGGLFIRNGGRIELGSVAGPAFVNLTPVPNGWAFGYDEVANFQDIFLFNTAGIGISIDEDVNGIGEIRLQGRNISLAPNSQIGIINDGSGSGGRITIIASEQLELGEQATISTTTSSTGTSADIFIRAKQLRLQGNNIFIGTQSEESATGRAGNLTIEASDSVEIDAEGSLSQLFTQTFGSGDAGALSITTSRLVLSNGGQVNSSTFGSGNGGRININISSIEISGQGSRTEGPISSGIFSITSRAPASSLEQEVTGRGGSININTSSLVLRDGGTISVGSGPGSLGQAGDITIDSADISLFGDSSIISNAAGGGSGGNIGITTDNLFLQNSRISANSVESFGGRVDITAAGIFSTQPLERSITATSDAGSIFNGTVNTNIINVDPNKSSTQLSSDVVDPDKLIAQNPCRRGSNSEFIIAGRGSLPPNISDDLSTSVTQVDLITPVPHPASADRVLKNHSQKLNAQSVLPESLTPLVPAQGWVFTETGDVSLVAYNPVLSGPERLPSAPSACPTP